MTEERVEGDQAVDCCLFIRQTHPDEKNDTSKEVHAEEENPAASFSLFFFDEEKAEKGGQTLFGEQFNGLVKTDSYHL